MERPRLGPEPEGMALLDVDATNAGSPSTADLALARSPAHAAAVGRTAGLGFPGRTANAQQAAETARGARRRQEAKCAISPRTARSRAARVAVRTRIRIDA